MTPEHEAAALFKGGVPLELPDGRMLIRDPGNLGRAWLIERPRHDLRSLLTSPVVPLPVEQPYVPSSMLRNLERIAERHATDALVDALDKYIDTLRSLGPQPRPDTLLIPRLQFERMRRRPSLAEQRRAAAQQRVVDRRRRAQRRRAARRA